MKKKVLVVDDDNEFLRLISAWLKSQELDVVAAVDGLSCISVARTESPDLIVLDVGMPAGNGFVAIERLRGLLPLSGVPIVVVSAGSADAQGPKALAAGANDYVEKSAGKEAIVNAVLHHLGCAARAAS